MMSLLVLEFIIAQFGKDSHDNVRRNAAPCILKLAVLSGSSIIDGVCRLPVQRNRVANPN